MSETRPISEDDLQAYVDDVLDAVRRAEVEAYLAQHPAVAGRVEGYVRQRAALRAALRPVVEEPVPPEHDLSRLIAARRGRGPARWRAVAAAVAWLAVGAAGGWSLHRFQGPAGQGPAGGIVALAREAADNYAVYGPDRVRPVEIRAADRGALVRWISDRLGRRIAVPDLAAAGYRFMGGRLVATPHGPAGLFMYDDDHGTRLVMFVRPMADQRNAPMSEGSHPGSEGRPVTGFTWADRGMGYSLVGAAAPGILHPLADEIRRQIDGAA